MIEKASFGKKFDLYSSGDIHVHSNYSDSFLSCDGTISPEQLVDLAEKNGHSFLAITDHDTIASAVRGREYAIRQGYEVEVVVGAEVSSTDGHILALGLESNIPFWDDLESTVRKIHRQGGLAIPAHPFYSFTSSIGREGLIQIAQSEDPEVYWDGIEVFNAGANDFRYLEQIWHHRDSNRIARRFYKENEAEGLYGASVAGSDTHTAGVGRALTVVPFGMDVLTAVRTGNTGVVMTGQREELSPRIIYEINRKSRALE